MNKSSKEQIDHTHYLMLAQTCFTIIRNLSVCRTGSLNDEMAQTNLKIIGELADILHNIPTKEVNPFVENVLIRDKLIRFVSDYPQYLIQLRRFIVELNEKQN